MKKAAWILGDQLSLNNSALRVLDKATDMVVMTESLEHARELSHHKHKLMLCFSAMRHFKQELEQQGYSVCYSQLDENKNFLDSLNSIVRKHGVSELIVMQPNESATVKFVETLSENLGIAVAQSKNTMFLTDRDEFVKKHRGKSHLVMENYYRQMRKTHNVLMTKDGKPVGGEWNLDKENRRTAKAFKQSKLTPPKRPAPTRDRIDSDVAAMVEKFFPNNIGSTKTFWLPTTRKDADLFFDDFIATRLKDFGDYEDVMIADELVLFHSAISPLLNIGLLDVMTLARKAEHAYYNGDAPLNSVEGFIRQIIGWREFIYGCYWTKSADTDYHQENFFGNTRKLPDFFWTGKTNMRCVSSAISKVIEHGYTHHIERLMVIGNFALLAGILPNEINRWFWEFYADAYDWVVTPNVMGMSQFADGGFVATKPYAASANYIDKMSDYCHGCAYDKTLKTGETACPFNYLYWDFFLRNSDKLRKNNRIGMAYVTLDKKTTAEQDAIRQSAHSFLANLNPNDYY
jgi:deoxyribodipyrimidine photolyase-related protein